MVVVADEEVRSAFFRAHSSTPHRAEPGNKATTTIIMQTNALSVRYAQQRAFSPKKWLDAKSESFTKLCEETVTRREVLRANLVFALITLGAIVAETSLLAAFACVTLAGYNVYKLNAYNNNKTAEQKGGEL